MGVSQSSYTQIDRQIDDKRMLAFSSQHNKMTHHILEMFLSSILSDYFTWFRGICLSSFGAEAVFPTYSRILDKVSNMAEQLAEAHVCGMVYSIVQQSGSPQEGLFPQQHTVKTSKTLFSRISWFQSKLLSPNRSGPWLHAVIHTP